MNSQVLAAQPAYEHQDICRKLALPGLKNGEACILGEDHGGAFDFILWGDSHAGHYVPAVGALAVNAKLSRVAFVQNGCPPFLEDPNLGLGCRGFNSLVAHWIEGNRIKVAVLASAWTAQMKNLRPSLSDASPSRNEAGLAKTLAFLSSRGAEISVLDQTPSFSQEVQLCVARALFYGRNTEHCVTEPSSRWLSLHKELDGYFEYLRKEYSFSVTSGAGAICDGEFCRAMKGDTLLMLDNNHLSRAGALLELPYLKIPLLNPPPYAVPGAKRPLPASEGSPPSIASPL